SYARQPLCAHRAQRTMQHGMLAALRSDAYRQAALWYFLYGVVYLVGAVLALTPRRMVPFWGIPWWAFYVVGALLVVTLPVLVWRGYKGSTRIRHRGPTAKALSVCWRQGRLMSGAVVAGDAATDAANRASFVYNWFFLLVAVVAAIMLLRAGWGREPQQRRAR